MGSDAATAVQSLLASVSKPAHGVIGTAIGVAVLLFGATTVFGELQDALDRIWRAPARAKTSGLWRLLRARLLSFGMILGLAFLLMVSLVLGAVISALGKWWGPLFGGWEVLAQIVNVVVGFVLTTAVFAMIYKLMPRVHVRWHDVWLGAIVTSLLFTVGKFLIGLYIGKSGVASGFGAAGSLVVVFVWVYYSAQIFLVGAEFTWVYAQDARLAARHRRQPRRSRRRPPPPTTRRREATAASRHRPRRGAVGARTAPAPPPRQVARRPRARVRRSATSVPASPSSSPCASSSLACCAASEDRDLEHQRRQPPPAAPARVAGRGRARRRRAAGAEGDRRRVPARRARGRRLRRGLARPAHLERRRDPGARREPIASRRALPGDDPADAQSRYIEAAVDGVLDRLDLPAERQPAAGARSSPTSWPGSSA